MKNQELLEKVTKYIDFSNDQIFSRLDRIDVRLKHLEDDVSDIKATMATREQLDRVKLMLEEDVKGAYESIEKLDKRVTRLERKAGLVAAK